LIAVNDDYRDRVVLIDLHTRHIVWQYGHTDTKGNGAGYLNTPDGMDLLGTRRALARRAVRTLLEEARSPVRREEGGRARPAPSRSARPAGERVGAGSAADQERAARARLRRRS